jgi:hypothetical protein
MCLPPNTHQIRTARIQVCTDSRASITATMLRSLIPAVEMDIRPAHRRGPPTCHERRHSCLKVPGPQIRVPLRTHRVQQCRDISINTSLSQVPLNRHHFLSNHIIHRTLLDHSPHLRHNMPSTVLSQRTRRPLLRISLITRLYIRTLSKRPNLLAIPRCLAIILIRNHTTPHLYHRSHNLLPTGNRLPSSTMPRRSRPGPLCMKPPLPVRPIPAPVLPLSNTPRTMLRPFQCHTRQIRTTTHREIIESR